MEIYIIWPLAPRSFRAMSRRDIPSTHLIQRFSLYILERNLRSIVPRPRLSLSYLRAVCVERSVSQRPPEFDHGRAHQSTRQCIRSSRPEDLQSHRLQQRLQLCPMVHLLGGPVRVHPGKTPISQLLWNILLVWSRRIEPCCARGVSVLSSWPRKGWNDP